MCVLRAESEKQFLNIRDLEAVTRTTTYRIECTQRTKYFDVHDDDTARTQTHTHTTQSNNFWQTINEFKQYSMQSFWVKHLPTGVVCRSFFHISREIFKHALHAPDKARAPINGERDILVNRRTSGVADDPRKSKHIRKRRHSESINRTYSSYSRVYGIVLFFYGLGLLLTPRRQSQ